MTGTGHIRSIAPHARMVRAAPKGANEGTQTRSWNRPGSMSSCFLPDMWRLKRLGRDRGFADSPVEEARFEPSVPLALGLHAVENVDVRSGRGRRLRRRRVRG